ncbi:hypothetical protein J1P26_17390 [Neobacillus sp. MM2021_6]|uniref:hypothetical protein n=1 Tax=Bacillaceae TaxID=186817 RepID=UPI00140E73DD|nr:MULTISPECIES: hypothetical protein [Bacillaceae]MBO0961483.1 hypothetical protein [Neobacillus sp. MM2021_6]NHC19587.1 hypothetical protein [Bacillus sp. MM2020_4]
MKVLVAKENYEQVREAEKVAGKKIKHLKMYVPDCINGVWGVYQIIRCYKSFTNYFAEMKLIKEAESEVDAHLKMMGLVDELRR